MSKKYANTIVGFVWLLLLYLIIVNNMSQLLLTMLFVVFILHFSEDFTGKYFTNLTIKKIVSLVFSFVVISLAIYALYKSIEFMWIDLNVMIVKSEELIFTKLKHLGVSDSISTIKDAYLLIFTYLKSNLGALAFSAGLLLKVLLGIILGILFHFSKFNFIKIDNTWDYIMSNLSSQSTLMYYSFKDIMSIQFKIALMNTVIISTLALVITPLFYDQFLPYWYVIIPLTIILSLIPVIGNIALNLIVFLSTIQLSTEFAFAGIAMFLFIHKLEFLVIGKQMEQKIGITLVIVILSMIIGESLFHSMSGMFLGLIFLVTLSRLLKQTNLIYGEKQC